MGLFDPAWKTEDRNKLEKALSSVQKTKKPIDLLKIALTAPLEAVQLAAVEQLDDQELLKEVARTETTNKYSSPLYICVRYKTREKAVDKIRSQERLYDIVTTASDSSVDGKRIALYALSRLTDPELLKKAAMNKEGSWQFAAAGRIKDENVLGQIVRNPPTRDAADIAAAGIGDFDLLLEMFSRYNSGYVYSQLNFLLSPPEHFIVDPHKHDVIGITVQNIGRMEFHRKHPNSPVTEEQRVKYMDLLIHGKIEIWDWSLFRTEELERMFWGSPVSGNNRHVLEKLYNDPDYPPERLWNLLKPVHVSGGCKPDLNRFVLQKIEERIREVNDPEVLLEWIKDPETEPHFAAKCLKVLFTKDWAGKIKWSHDRGISTLQDEAVRALQANLMQGDQWVRSYCLTTIVQLLSHEMLEVYGIKCSRDEREDEDGYGRYTYEQTMIHYKGYTVDYYNGII